MTIIINLIGQPSCGKTSTSVKLLAYLKELGIECEYCPEAAKTYLYEGKKINKYMQFGLFGSECVSQSRLFGSVDIIISDSSPILAAFYEYFYNGDNALSPACKEFYKKAKEDEIHVINFFLPRKKKYNPKGRYQNEKEAADVAAKLKEWLTWEGYDYEVLDCPDEKRISAITERLKNLTNNFEGMMNE